MAAAKKELEDRNSGQRKWDPPPCAALKAIFENMDMIRYIFQKENSGYGIMWRTS